MESEASVAQIITEYYINFIPWINGILWPLFALLAVVFFTSRLAKNSEIVAALSAGMSYSRLLRPFMITACTLAFIHFLAVTILFLRAIRHFAILTIPISISGILRPSLKTCTSS